MSDTLRMKPDTMQELEEIIDWLYDDHIEEAMAGVSGSRSELVLNVAAWIIDFKTPPPFSEDWTHFLESLSEEATEKIYEIAEEMRQHMQEDEEDEEDEEEEHISERERDEMEHW